MGNSSSHWGSKGAGWGPDSQFGDFNFERGERGGRLYPPIFEFKPKKTKRTLKKEIFFRIYSTDAILMSTPEDGKKFAT